MNQNIDLSLLNELNDHVKFPPGGDKSLSLFYQALVLMYEQNHPVADLLHGVKKNRANLTNKHLINLLFRSFQYIKFEQNDLTYREYSSHEQWVNQIDKIVRTKKTAGIFFELLTKKNTTTTIYQRYIGPYVLMSKMFDDNPISIADFGCGGNYGLRGLELNEPFKPVVDLTPNKQIIQLLSKNINFKKGLAVDRENPDKKEVKKWRMACSFYPIELDSLEEVFLFEERLKKSVKVKFVRADLLSISKVPKHKFDVIILSTIMYEMTTVQQTLLLDKVKQFLREDGVIVVQDFAEKNTKYFNLLNFDVSWFGKEFSFRTFVTSRNFNWQFKEILQWNNGRCAKVRMGEDFEILFKNNQLNTSSAALAQVTS